MHYYTATGFQWEKGQIVSHHDFAEGPHKSFFVKAIPVELIGNPDFLARRGVEMELEKLRETRFPTYPSRKTCMFLSLTIDDCMQWVRKPSRPDYRVYELEPVAVESVTTTNLIWYNYAVRLAKGEMRGIFSNVFAEEYGKVLLAYWGNIGTEEWGESSAYEVLFEGRLRVIADVTVR